MEPNQVQDTPETSQAVDPKVQEEFDILVINGMNIIHSEKAAKGIVGKIKGSANKVQATAEVTVDIITRLVDSALSSNVDISKDALVHGANFLMGEIITLAEKAGIEPFSEEEKAQVFQAAVSMYLDKAVKQGKITQEELAQLSEEAKQTEKGREMAVQIESRQRPQGQPQEQQQGILAQGGM